MLCALLSCGRSADGPRPPTPPAARPNLILISLDALRYDRTGLAPAGTAAPAGSGLAPPRAGATPHLVRFAESAAVFHDATSPAPWTVPAHLAIWTGLFPSRHGMVNKLVLAPGGSQLADASLDPSIPTLPELLIRQGYTAAAFTGGAGVSGRFGMGRGFSRYVDDRRFAGLDYSMPRAIEWLRAHRERPFLLFLHGYDVHGQHPVDGATPQAVAPWYRGPLDGSIEEQARLREKGLEATRILGQTASLSGVITGEDGRFLLDLYDHKIATADRLLGVFLDELASLGLLDTSIIAIFSDHGEEFLDHGHIDHGHSLLQEQLHVPMLLRFPGDTSRRDIRAPVQTFDLLPTVFAALGLEVPPGLDGRNLLPALRTGNFDLDRPIFAESDYRLFVHHRAVRQRSGKLILDLRSGRRWRYDLASDPGERGTLPGIEERSPLAPLLEGWFKHTLTDPATFFLAQEAPIVLF